MKLVSVTNHYTLRLIAVVTSVYVLLYQENFCFIQVGHLYDVFVLKLRSLTEYNCSSINLD